MVKFDKQDLLNKLDALTFVRDTWTTENVERFLNEVASLLPEDKKSLLVTEDNVHRVVNAIIKQEEANRLWSRLG